VGTAVGRDSPPVNHIARWTTSKCQSESKDNFDGKLLRRNRTNIFFGVALECYVGHGVGNDRTIIAGQLPSVGISDARLTVRTSVNKGWFVGAPKIRMSSREQAEN